jgi:hypothetical protein
VRAINYTQGDRTDIMMLLAELADGAHHHGTPTNAAAYRRAAEDVAEERTDEVRIGRALYKVQPGQGRPERYALHEGARAEILADLEGYRAARAPSPGRPDKSQAYAAAIEEIRGGVTRVRVRSSVWQVTDG